MRKLLCMMLILLGLSACTAGEVPADSSIPPQPATSEGKCQEEFGQK